VYLQHFGLEEAPFQLTPDTEFFFNYASHREALQVLTLAVANGEGFLKVTGEVGTGKTLLCRMLLNTLGEEYATAYIPNPRLEPNELYHAVADELGLRLRANTRPHRVLDCIGKRLIELADQGRRVLLLVDEAQAMPLDTLEALRLITNLETEKRKLLQVVLFGQSELNEHLAAPSTRQILQRITFSYRLRPMDREGVAGYVSHRLAVAGHNGPALFRSGALKELHRASGGIPRLVNTLANKALMAAYGRGDPVVQRKHVRQAYADSLEQVAATEGRSMEHPPRRLSAYAFAGLVLVSALGLLELVRRGGLNTALARLLEWFA